MIYYKVLTFLMSFLILFSSCDTTTTTVDGAIELNILPHPKQIHSESRKVLLTDRSKVYTEEKEVEPLLVLFVKELQKLSNIELEIAAERNDEVDMIFKLDSAMASDEYRLEIDRRIEVIGGSYTALAMAKATLLQLVSVESGQICFPVVSIRDYPDAAYRGLLIDLARQWHSMATVKKLIDLAAFYKINYVQLHFTDYQSYTLPSKAYPDLATEGRKYSFGELRELESYSQQRGVTIIPELEVPGHASQFVRKHPEIFAIQDIKENPWIINMGKEEVYVALDKLIGELCEIFTATPYFHIGGDEAIFHKVMDDEEVQSYIEAHAIGNDVHELYRHFLVRMNEIVKKYQKQMCVWEGFGPDGEIPIPKDIIVFEFETNRYLPDRLVADGYTVVNASWKPLYVVNQKKWEPKTILGWNLWRWENWFDQAPSFVPIQVEKSPLIIGAQMCSWEQAEKVEIPSLRRRLPAFIERIWNADESIPYEEFMDKLDQTDERLSKIIGDNRQDSLLIGHNFKK